MYVQFLFQLKQKKENKMFTKVLSRKLITLERKYYFCPLTTRNVENLSQIIWFSLKIKGNYDILSSTGFLLLFLCMTSLFTCRIIGYLSDIYTQRLNISIVLLLLKQIPNKPLLLYSQYNSRTNMVVHSYLWSKLQSIITSL